MSWVPKIYWLPSLSPTAKVVPAYTAENRKRQNDLQPLRHHTGHSGETAFPGVVQLREVDYVQASTVAKSAVGRERRVPCEVIEENQLLARLVSLITCEADQTFYVSKCTPCIRRCR
jgi:hypothetical protein